MFFRLQLVSQLAVGDTQNLVSQDDLLDRLELELLQERMGPFDRRLVFLGPDEVGVSLELIQERVGKSGRRKEGEPKGEEP